MRQKSHSTDLSSEELVKGIRRATRKRYSAEEKIRIVLDGLRGEHSIAELCRREGIAEGLYYSWSKEFLEAGKRRLAGDTARAATSDEVKDLKPGRAVAPTGATNPGHAGHPTIDILPLVRSVSIRWSQGVGRQAVAAGSRLEPYPR